ncbi:hypothetical protein SLEP1_g22157 [Rubroshorea leprosula]|uniref:Uncharacterized protein n=1 Tax=Rubroshorea leprosula TaxID=152421 RepID=A0AAV5JH57_9ROSI|nr:hypothetical protein SLEP1_g22157 [Rubroshorea leprosula]
MVVAYWKKPRNSHHKLQLADRGGGEIEQIWKNFLQGEDF